MDTDVVSQDYETEFADVDALAQDLYALVETLPCPVAMAARGALVGMGFVVSLSCDFLVVGTETTLSVPEVKYGIASVRTAERLPDLVGRRPAAELLLTGDPIDPERAYELGLANDVVPEDAVEDRTRELLATVADHDRETVGEVCRLLGGERDAD
jgi:enoyl-CoA hydratase/carnithine racemase